MLFRRLKSDWSSKAYGLGLIVNYDSFASVGGAVFRPRQIDVRFSNGNTWRHASPNLTRLMPIKILGRFGLYNPECYV